jgi:SAM-dependent methyltransferase
MRVVRDFESLYRSEHDPWAIGDATSERYNKYYDFIAPHMRGAVLDIGCGMGALLARFREKARTLEGIELSRTAVKKGQSRFPFIKFHQGSAAALDDLPEIRDKRFDFIICSDVICYLKDPEKDGLVKWISSHLSPDGKALVAGWSPGGKYPTASELTLLAQRRLNVVDRQYFEKTGHLALLTARTRRLVAITVDYETWHPIPSGKRIDWDADVFQPTERLFNLFEKTGVKATFFAEMGEYFWLGANEPLVARRMEEQWRKAIQLGHDVQLHLHPCWLPETAATCVESQWHWDWSKSKADAYPEDLTALIGRCKAALEAAIRPIRPAYVVTSFRAGAYQAQPFERLSRALIENGIFCDSSVHPHGTSDERGYNYSFPYTRHQPYFADLLDPQLKAVPAEEQIVELPIFTPEPGQRWFVDGSDGETLAGRLVRYEKRLIGNFSISRRRAINGARKVGIMLYSLAWSRWNMINRIVPRRLAHALLVAHTNRRGYGNLYYVAIGHTKAELRLSALERNLIELKDALDVEYVTLSDMARAARDELRSQRRKSQQEEIVYQGQRETPAILREALNVAQSYYLQDMIPLDVERILDIGCGAGYWSARIASLYPWVEVTGIDAGTEFIEQTQRVYADRRVRFELGDFADLQHPDRSFDCVYAENTLVHSFDLNAALSEIYRVLKHGGCLVAALPLDGLAPDYDCDNHTWKTVSAQVVHRLGRIGFVNIFVQVIDTYLKLGMPPYRPSNDQMLYVRAWKAPGGESKLQRAKRAMDWLYRRIEPSKPNLSEDARQIIADGFSYCIGYTVALGQLLQREGYDITWVTMRAEDHSRGAGPRQRDTHEVIEVEVDGHRYVLDPMTNTAFLCSLDDLLKTPELADGAANRDERCRARGYELYNTSYWYRRVVGVSRRRNVRTPHMLWRKIPK